MTPLLTGVFASQISGHLTSSDSGAMFPIAMATVGSGGAANMEFTSIPDTYKHLQLRFFGNATSATSGALYLNGDTTTSNYYTHSMISDGTGTSASAFNNTYLPYYTSTGNYFSAHVFDILDYTSTSKKKTIRVLGGWDGNGDGRIVLNSALWNNTNKITSIKLLIDGSTNWNQYTQAVLYGIKG